MGSGILSPLARGAGATGRWAAIALGFSIPISVALDNVLLLVVLACWIAGGGFLSAPRLVRDNGVAQAALVLYALLVAGSLYGERDPGDAGRYLLKYLDLLFIPIFMSFFRHPAARSHAVYALAASLGLTLALSFLLKGGILPKTALLAGDAGNPIVFKLRLTHNILMAFATFLFAVLAVHARGARARLGWWCLAGLAALNVTVMVEGATGYLILGALALLLAYQRLRWRGVGLGIAAVAAAAAVLVMVPGPFQQRVTAIGNEIREWQPGGRSDTSAGHRLEFYHNTLPIIAGHPLIGTGTGGFPKAYAAQIRGTGSFMTANPHNEYLLITVQLGAIGLAALLFLFWRQWRLAPGLRHPLERDLARGLLAAIMVGCMLNSLLLDHTEGLLYAWLTGVLYAGLESPGTPSGPDA